MKVKLLWITDNDCYCNDCDSYMAIGIQDTEWEEISEDEFYELKNFVEKNKSYFGEQPILIRQPTPKEDRTLPKIASEFLEWKRGEKDRQEKIEKERQKKTIATLKIKEDKKKAKELKKLQELQKKYGTV